MNSYRNINRETIVHKKNQIKIRIYDNFIIYFHYLEPTFLSEAYRLAITLALSKPYLSLSIAH